MKVIKIKKSYCSGTIEHYLVLTDDLRSSCDIDDLAEDWCETDPAGMNNGYTFTWDYVEDELLIKSAVHAEILRINNQITSLNLRKNKLENYIK